MSEDTKSEREHEVAAPEMLCPICGKPMTPQVMPLDSAELPDGYSWMRYHCEKCEIKDE